VIEGPSSKIDDPWLALGTGSADVVGLGKRLGAVVAAEVAVGVA
jgi:hypothetical protein